MTSRTLEKITIVVALAVLGVAVAVNVRSTPALLLVGALVVTVSAGLDLALRGAPRFRTSPDLFILPAALVVGAVLFLQLLSSGPLIVAGLTVFGCLLFATFWAEYQLRREGGNRRVAIMTLGIICYVAAFVLYAAIYQAKTRTLFSAPAILLISLVLAARQLGLAQESTQESTTEEAAPEGRSDVPAARQAATFDTGSFDILSSDTGTFRALTSARLAQASPYGADASRAAPPRPARPDGAAGRGPERRHPSSGPWSAGMKTILYAAVVALATSEITWALNYWPVNGLFGGAFLLSGFYFMVGILSHHLQQRLSGRLVAEYGTVALAGTVLIAIAGLMRRAA